MGYCVAITAVNTVFRNKTDTQSGMLSEICQSPKDEHHVFSSGSSYTIPIMDRNERHIL